MRKTLYTITLLLALALPALAQDTIKVSTSFVNTDFSGDNRQGFVVEGDGRVLRRGALRIGGVFQFVKPCFDCPGSFDTFSAGPQFSFDVANGRVTPFARVLFGTTTNYNGLNGFTRTYGVGADVNFGRWFVRLGPDFQRIEGVPFTVNRINVGGGFRIGGSK